jgi:ribosomal protein S18 acetylase RimI-like enzyme
MRGPLPFAVREAEGDEVVRAGEVVAAAYLADGLASERYAARLRASRERAEAGSLVVAVHGDQVVGTVTYARAGSPLAELCQADPTGGGELRMLGVLPEVRGRGVADALVRWCVARARADGARRLLLSTQVEMRAAQRLYGRLGFTRRPDLDWTPEPGVQLLGLQLELPVG